ncbi:hypothetical protein BT96DRAFT_955688 [Gymnopus androsaceus JB14]|uniref:Uncharacterized protein n=1 Tax=Gymnopus androsaceus JB14 TaxID=1447944 RepID=A0A6A4I0P2_9AGAR|nr:hypothetical protein BT96DRAFT_955688 [Gymnopus androsaceus JB14]
MFLCSDSCSECLPASSAAECCQWCHDLQQNKKLEGIHTRITDSVNESAPFAYRGHGGMMVQIDDLRLRIAVCEGALDEHKQFVLAIASGKWERVDRLIRACMNAGMGIHGMLVQYERAAEGLYQPKGYEEKDNLRAILFWRLGAHRALALPSLSHARSHSTMTALVPSPATPNQGKILQNIDAFLTSKKVIHVVLMFNKIALEKRPRLDVKTNQHVLQTASKFENENNLNVMVEDVKQDEVHLASEATVGAIGILSGNSRIYGGRPILENAIAHAKLIQTAIDAVNSKKGEIPFQIISVASEGEAKRGKALVELTFKHHLSRDSPLYPLLSPLKFMNFFVGEDDLTADKDWKHVTFKRLRNLILRERGIMVNGILLTPSIFKQHLASDGYSPQHIQPLFDPEDEQDVKLAYSLLSNIWSLNPTVPEGSRAGFAESCEAILIFGKLCRHLIYPYICVDLSLSKQLEHLSAAAHLAIGLYVHEGAGRKFLPNQLFLNIMIMIKNAYFVLVKQRLTCLNWNHDLLQLVEHLVGTTEASNILAQYPQWNKSLCRLAAPLVHRDMLSVADKRGRQIIEEECPFLIDILKKLDTLSGCDILQPFGVPLIHAELTEDDWDDLMLRGSNSNSPSAMDEETADRLDGHQMLEDMAAEAMEPLAEKVECTVIVGSTSMSKSHALSLAFKHLGSPSSTDRLKHVCEESCYHNKETEHIINNTPHSTFIMTTEPIATLLQCDNHLFLCIGEIKNIRWDSKPAEQLQLDCLLEKLTSISFQLISIIPATSEDDSSLRKDWCSSSSLSYIFKVPGSLVLPINPKLSTQMKLNPVYLFESSELIWLVSSLHEKVSRHDLKGVPSITCSNNFPYLDSSG